jgi:hypothetical protein
MPGEPEGHDVPGAQETVAAVEQVGPGWKQGTMKARPTARRARRVAIEGMRLRGRARRELGRSWCSPCRYDADVGKLVV